MCGNYHQYHTPCGHSGIVGINSCKGFGTTCLGPDPSKGMDITLPAVDTLCEGCHATAHQPNPDARLDENDPYRKEARERAAALEKQASDFRAEQEGKRKAKEEEELAEVKRQETKRKAADDADLTVFPAKRKATGKMLREEGKWNEGKKGKIEEMKEKNKEAEAEEEEDDDENEGNEDDDDASDIYGAD